MTQALASAYREAEALLTEAARSLGQRPPERVPLRLGEGLLRSALARQLAPGPEAERLARALAEAAGPSCPPLFCQVQAQGGMLLLPFSQGWYRQVLVEWNRLPLPEALPPLPTPGRRDGGDVPFLLDYTARRCARMAGAWEGELPAGLVCLLAQGPAGPGWPERVARGYWRLSPALRRDRALAGAVGRAVLGCRP